MIKCHHATAKCHYATTKCHSATAKCHSATAKCHSANAKCHYAASNSRPDSPPTITQTQEDRAKDICPDTVFLCLYASCKSAPVPSETRGGVYLQSYESCFIYFFTTFTAL